MITHTHTHTHTHTQKRTRTCIAHENISLVPFYYFQLSYQIVIASYTPLIKAGFITQAQTKDVIKNEKPNKTVKKGLMKGIIYRKNRKRICTFFSCPAFSENDNPLYLNCGC